MAHNPLPTPPGEKWYSLKKWHNIRSLLEVIVFITLIFHLIPPDLEHKLTETLLGLFIILGVIIVFILIDNIRQSGVFSAYYKAYDEKLSS